MHYKINLRLWLYQLDRKLIKRAAKYACVVNPKVVCFAFATLNIDPAITLKMNWPLSHAPFVTPGSILKLFKGKFNKDTEDIKNASLPLSPAETKNKMIWTSALQAQFNVRRLQAADVTSFK